MAETDGRKAANNGAQVDWVGAERSPEFRELVAKKRSFVVPATIFFLAWYLGFILLAGYAPDFFGREFLFDGVTVGYAFALSQFVMVWVLTWMYLRRADREFDPLAKRAARRASDTAGNGRPPQAAPSPSGPRAVTRDSEVTPR